MTSLDVLVGRTAPLLIDNVTDSLEQTVEDSLIDLIEFVPELIVGVVILAAGYLIGSRLEPVVARFVNTVQVDERVESSRLGDAVADEPERQSDGGTNPGRQPQRETVGVGPGRQYGPIARAAGLAVKYYVILFAAFVAAERMGLARLGESVERLVLYAPTFLAGVAVILVGLLFADYAAQRVRASDLATESAYGVWISALVQGLLYLLVLVVGLEMIGFELRIIYTIVDGVASAIGVGLTFAIAVAIGIAGGLFARDYYQENLQDEVID